MVRAQILVPSPHLPLVLRAALAFVMVGMGALHFVVDDVFVQMVPPGLPGPYLLVWISGVVEVALGIALLAPRARRAAGFGLVALFVAVFPANVYMAVANLQVHGLPPWLPQPSAGALWARLPLQAVFIAWALVASEIWPSRARVASQP